LDLSPAKNQSGAAYRALVRQRLETYVTAVVTHFKDRVYAWDVVNEVVSDSAGEVYRETSPWYVALGPDYIEYALRAARAADPSAQLFINDYSTENSAKLERLLAIVQDLLSRGAPLDGVGHQFHLQRGSSASAVAQALIAVENLGLVNHVTELDVSVYSDPGSCFSSRTACQTDYGDAVPPAALAAQADLYGQLFAAFKQRPSLKSVTTWGISDAHTWLDTFPVSRTNLPLLFDTQRLPKQAFWAATAPGT
jgi:endo-1,4-beta-xylanase